ncbi:MAG: translation initiation factor IF-3 [Desulfobacca sp.]|nr:translation initiation factor IF-3 [Desulfobacca sp.]
MSKSANVNNEIRAANVRVIGEGGVQLGILPLAQALALAKGEGLDLVEVAPQLDPPVCRIMDYGKFRYQQTKKVHEAKKRRTIIQVKEVKIRPKTEEHDYQFKLRNIRKFLEKKNKTKISLMFRGREIQYQEAARKILNRISEETKDLAIVEQDPKLEGRNMTMILGPK